MANNRFNKQVSPKGYADGGTVKNKKLKLLNKLGATDKEKEFYAIKGGDVSGQFKGIAKDLKELRKKGIKTTTPALLEKLNRKNRKGKK